MSVSARRQLLDKFSPFYFVTVMGTGISSNILHSFPYDARWLRICSYIMFSVACILFVTLLTMLAAVAVVHMRERSLRNLGRLYFFDYTYSLFWGTLVMGYITIINYIFQLANDELKGRSVANGLVIFVYVLWWTSVVLSLGSAWGLTFCIWLKHNRYWDDSDLQPCTKNMQQRLQSTLLLPVVPLVVVTSSSGIFTMSQLFVDNTTRNVQLLTLGVTALIWFNALLLTVLVVSTYVWNLYVNKIPPLNLIFTMFLVVGPMGQGAYGIMLFTDNIKRYIERYYPFTAADGEIYLVCLAVKWSFKVCGIVLSLLLISNGIFFTLLAFAAIASYGSTLRSRHTGPKVTAFHKGWWAMTFPLGTMALGSKELYAQYHQYVPISAFRVVSVIYSVLCVGSTIGCLAGSIWIFSRHLLALRSSKPKLLSNESLTDTSDQNQKLSLEA
ncbi:LAME_0H07162g1_1 [Lachancea meyersii CBS 8951]|uniref:LAME_0H07162g1_1 n=1 Tax=Lachancea meyersii CBS 8951 TaxID=1266667 RepID=A0A1G4KF34_9SACH|nr:LAME_0H07162g1_1 [Lachancea meyersii CBS 8951]